MSTPYKEAFITGTMHMLCNSATINNNVVIGLPVFTEYTSTFGSRNNFSIQYIADEVLKTLRNNDCKIISISPKLHLLISDITCYILQFEIIYLFFLFIYFRIFKKGKEQEI